MAMANGFSPTPDAAAPEAAPQPVPMQALGSALGQPAYSDEDLKALVKKCKRESFDQRWVFERQWLRNIYYVLGRQWIYYNTRQGEWQDKRLAKWIPRPVTNLCKEAVQAIRAMFAAIRLGVNIRPNGQDPKNVSAAATSDELAPVLHEEHNMNLVQTEFDWWLIATGNAFIHTYWDYDPKYGTIDISYEQCAGCGQVTPSTELVGAQPVCPKCQGTAFQPAVDPTTGAPMTEKRPVGRGTTSVLSPLELAFPYTYARFDDVPYVIRLRWRTKSYYMGNEELAAQVATINWQKAPSDRSLQIFKSLSTQNDLGLAPANYSSGSGGGTEEDEGIAEYELWYKPCEQYPDGLVVRWIDTAEPIILHSEVESLPGPFPYRDAEQNPLFTFAHASFEHVGGRVLGSGALDPVIQKQDQINQLDSMIQMIIQRMANPVWLEPKGAEVEKFTGEPGLVVKWNPLTVGGNAKPERIAGEGPHGSFFQIREMYMADFERATGTFDIIKGAKPTGVEAFSALQLLTEQGQKRFTTVFTARGEVYKQWFKFAIELEREFGPDTRTKAILSPAKTWTFKNFKNAELQGSMSIVVEDGTQTPKTALGMRAAVDHANTLGMLNMQDPDQQYEGLKMFGLTQMVPSLDVHVQAALQKQQAFEEWIANPTAVNQSIGQAKQADQVWQQQAAEQAKQPATPGPDGVPQPPMITPPPSPLASTPLKWKKWYNPIIHKQEFMKWANSDQIRELLTQYPQAEGLLEAHLMEMDQAIQEIAMQQAMAQMAMQGPGSGAQQQGPPPQGSGQGQGGAKKDTPQSGGAKQATANSNRAGASQNVDHNKQSVS